MLKNFAKGQPMLSKILMKFCDYEIFYNYLFCRSRANEVLKRATEVSNALEEAETAQVMMTIFV